MIRQSWQGFTAWVVACWLAVGLQATWLAESIPFRLDLAAILLGYLGLRARRDRLLPAAIVLGAVSALFTVEAPAIRVMECAAIGAVLLAVRPFLFGEHVATRGLVFVGTAMAFAFCEAWVRLPANRLDLGVGLLLSTSVSALSTGLVGIAADGALHRMGFCRRLWRPRRVEFAS